MSKSGQPKVSRRDFLKKVGAGVVAVSAMQLLLQTADPVQASAGPATNGCWGILIDLTRCTGCNSCTLACKEANNLPVNQEFPQALASDTFTFVDKRQVTLPDGTVDTRYVKRQCMHCLNAACVSACPAAAMYNSGTGPVIYRSNRCLGCRYCQVACPFEVPRFEWQNGLDPVISKCWMCYNRLQEGKKPACAEACPNGALRFGRRDELLAQARAQIISNPGRYIDHIYGETEVGGTSMMYLSDVPFEQLGFRTDLPNTAPPEETEKIMSKLPYVITGMATLITGAALYAHRKTFRAVQIDEKAVKLPESDQANYQEE